MNAHEQRKPCAYQYSSQGKKEVLPPNDFVVGGEHPPPQTALDWRSFRDGGGELIIYLSFQQYPKAKPATEVSKAGSAVNQKEFIYFIFRVFRVHSRLAFLVFSLPP